MTSSPAARLRTALALGPRNILRVGWYRFGLRTGLSAVRRLVASPVAGPYFQRTSARIDQAPPDAWREDGRLFGWLPVTWPAGAFPDWHANPLTNQRLNGARRRPWWEIADFDHAIGDIKTLWDLSRFDWALAMAQRAAAGELGEWDRLNAWLEDWMTSNPPYRGPNWKCGQEASIRVMHLAMAAVIAEQFHRPLPGLLDLVEAHLRRIAPTVSYATAQDNNHGTSEAAALFIGGSWLARSGRHAGQAWELTGRALLEDRVLRLVEPDGSFSQYSVNYHRLLLDTLSIAEIWRRHNRLQGFSDGCRGRAAAAAEWLRVMVDPVSGDAPNLGANDGARLLPLSTAGYRDFRPCVQLATALFTGARAYEARDSWDDPLHWLRVPLPDRRAEDLSNRLFDDGGYAVLRGEGAMALLRYPRFRFRPGQADALHVDLWAHGENLLRDAGTFSYNAANDVMAYFSGSAAHNTIQFDGRDQMPRLGRFLYGDWLRTHEVMPLGAAGGATSAGASYRDGLGATHTRALTLAARELSVRDQISGFSRAAVLRWRLRPGAWKADGGGVFDGAHRLDIDTSMPIVRMGLVEGWESRFYLQKTPLPVLEVEVGQPGTLTSRYRWSG